MTHWFSGHTSTRATLPAPEPALTTEQPLPSQNPAVPVNGAQTSAALPVNNPLTTRPVTNLSPAITPWEQQMDDILSSNVDITLKAKQFVALIPRLPASGQVEAAEHAANLLPDDQYADLGKVLVDPTTSEAVIDVLLADLLDRPNSVKLPLLLQIARTANHPGQMEAREDLIFYLDEDLGNDWAIWERKLAAYVQENPD